MLSYSEARYVITEISRIDFYRQCIAKYQTQIDDLEKEKLDLTVPTSPNGHESIGEAKGNAVSDYTRQLIDIIARQDEIKKEQFHFIGMLKKAEAYLDELMRSPNADYVEDYLKTRDKRSLQEKYDISNAYDRMVRIIRSEVNKF